MPFHLLTLLVCLNSARWPTAPRSFAWTPNPNPNPNPGGPLRLCQSDGRGQPGDRVRAKYRATRDRFSQVYLLSYYSYAYYGPAMCPDLILTLTLTLTLPLPLTLTLKSPSELAEVPVVAAAIAAAIRTEMAQAA